MTISSPRWALVLAFAVFFLCDGSLFAADPVAAVEQKLPRPADVRSIEIYPQTVNLVGGDASFQLIVTGVLAGDQLVDLTGGVTYEAADPKVVRITSSGRVLPLTDGTTTITAHFGDRVSRIPVTTKQVAEDLPINFANQVVPVFTKLGCNSGGCHGKMSGQNGFRLSLLGFDPELDYTTLVKEGRGRRVFAPAPDNSLLLLKASGAVAHGGGKRLEVGSDEYKIIRRWIAGGLAVGSDKDPVVEKLSVYPEHRAPGRQSRQQIAIYAHYTDGRVLDVTRLAQYDSNDPEVALVDATGLVQTLAYSGEAAIMARFAGQVTVFRAAVPLGVPTPPWQFETLTVVDRFTPQKWRELGLVPSELCTDEEFIRRVYVDITGTLPTPAQRAAFLDDRTPNKRDLLVDALVDSPEYGYTFANKWADILRVKRGNIPARAYGTFSFHNWIRESLTLDMPYDEFARNILMATGDENHCPPTVWYKDQLTPDQFVDNTSQVFLGVRLQCAQCHHHPYEKWSPDDYWGLAAYFGRLGRKTVPVPGLAGQNAQQQRQILFVRNSGTVINKRTNKTAVMKPLDGEPVFVASDEDPRQKLAEWLTAPQNPYFARAVANRYWAHFFGRGLVDPLDDMRVTNPPSNPELLDALAKELVDHKYSLKHLVRVICKSHTYQLSSVPNDFNKHDKHTYARYYPKRLSAEVLYDAVNQVTNGLPTFPGLPSDRHAPTRAIMLPDESYQSYFLDVFGRPQRLSSCECERVSEANLAQVLHLLNSEDVQTKLSRTGGRADVMAKDARPDAEKVEELFLWAVGHKPSQKQLDLAIEHLRNAKSKKLGYEDVVWALLNSKEFYFNK